MERESSYEPSGALVASTTSCFARGSKRPTPCPPHPEFVDRPAPVYPGVESLPFSGLLGRP